MLEAAHLLYFAWAVDDRIDHGHTAHDPAFTQNWGQPVRSVDAILDRDNGGIRADQRLDECAGGLQVPELGCEDHIVHRADFRRIIGRLGRVQQEVAAHTVDLQAFLADGL